jgi:XTP/dITP diphosphohydrolase
VTGARRSDPPDAARAEVARARAEVARARAEAGRAPDGAASLDPDRPSASVLLVATRSAHKLGELRDLLALARTRLVSLDDLGLDGEPVEDGETFAANAAVKARFYARLSGLPTLADDSGIEVDALDGGPGVRTRRYAGEGATDEQNNVKLLGALRGLSPAERGARYRCVLAFADPSAAGPRGGIPIVLTRGTLEGRIAGGPKGRGGFGYDPIFEPEGEAPGGRTLGEWSAAEKNAVSHRSRAARRMARVLAARGY